MDEPRDGRRDGGGSADGPRDEYRGQVHSPVNRENNATPNSQTEVPLPSVSQELIDGDPMGSNRFGEPRRQG